MDRGILTTMLADPGLKGAEVLTVVGALLNELGFSTSVLSIGGDWTRLPEEVSKAIQRSTVLLLLLSKGHLPSWLKGQREEVLFPSAWVAVLVEAGNLQQINGLRNFSRVIQFDQDKCADLSLATVRLLRACKNDLIRAPLQYLVPEQQTREELEPYQMLYVDKTVIIMPDGHGQIENRYRLEVIGQHFEGTTHYFGLNEYTPPGTELPSLEVLRNQPPTARFGGRSFSHKLLSPEGRKIKMAVVPLLHESTGRTKVFKFIFTPDVKPGTILDFTWAWSHADIFPPHGKDASTLKCLRHYREVRVCLLFGHEGTTPVFGAGGEPRMNIYNPLGIKLGTLQGKREPWLHGIQYSWRVFEVPAYTELAIEWERS